MARIDNLFDYDGPVMKFGAFLFDIILLDILWLLFSGFVPLMILFYLFGHTALANLPGWLSYLVMFILIIHWLPATCAMYYAQSRRYRGYGVYITKEFMHSYRQNYKQAILLSLLATSVILLLGYNIFLISSNAENFGSAAHILTVLQIVVGAEVLLTLIYAIALLARINIKTKELISTSFAMANKHLPYSLLCGAIVAVICALLYYQQIFFFLFVPSVACYFVMMILEKFVLNKYIPKDDGETEEVKVLR